MLQMQCFCSTQKPLRANGGFMSRAQREMAQPPAGHETIVSMVSLIQNPEIHFLGRNRPYWLVRKYAQKYL
ncbi:hypothetical protein [uncultured Nostoc sp.]|uniref:hypothetical protein n=1 Tax=uncultured Nostoc sp. TaxID=340711 RepID=UPI0035CC1C0A